MRRRALTFAKAKSELASHTFAKNRISPAQLHSNPPGTAKVKLEWEGCRRPAWEGRAEVAAGFKDIRSGSIPTPNKQANKTYPWENSWGQQGTLRKSSRL